MASSQLSAWPDAAVSVALLAIIKYGTGDNGVKDKEAERNAQPEAASQERNVLLDRTVKRIGPLQNAADLNIAAEEQQKVSLERGKYFLLLTRVDITTDPDILWPDKPV
ncbi:hypothetical protein E2L00_05875 [Cedecea colo]|uniref:Tail fiber assembly protein n=1 Tax=Cedecea colo TaxID=2552946 RepID=A0ABX0VK44_9ENTR|nr:hypothetical protein [Cedecea colo]